MQNTNNTNPAANPAANTANNTNTNNTNTNNANANAQAQQARLQQLQRARLQQQAQQAQSQAQQAQTQRMNTQATSTQLTQAQQQALLQRKMQMTDQVNALQQRLAQNQQRTQPTTNTTGSTSMGLASTTLQNNSTNTTNAQLQMQNQLRTSAQQAQIQRQLQYQRSLQSGANTTSGISNQNSNSSNLHSYNQGFSRLGTPTTQSQATQSHMRLPQSRIAIPVNRSQSMYHSNVRVPIAQSGGYPMHHHAQSMAAQQAQMHQMQMNNQERQDCILTSKNLQDLVRQVDPRERLEPEVENMLMEIAEDFIENVTSFACNLARHRKSDTLEVKDLQLHLERNWDIYIPGFSEKDDSKHTNTQSENHQQRMSLLKKTASTTSTVAKR